jgi:hypothetical protein
MSAGYDDDDDGGGGGGGGGGDDDGDRAVGRYLDARGKLVEARIAREGAEAQARQMAIQLQRMQAMGPAVFKAREHVIENILTLKCPRCQAAFIDWDGCMALTCAACGCGFCGWCLSDCGDDAHRHIERSCPATDTRGDQALFPSKAEYEAAWRTRWRKLLLQHLGKVEPEVAAQVAGELRTELEERQLGDIVRRFAGPQRRAGRAEKEPKKDKNSKKGFMPKLSQAEFDAIFEGV